MAELQKTPIPEGRCPDDQAVIFFLGDEFPMLAVWDGEKWECSTETTSDTLLVGDWCLWAFLPLSENRE